jgi:hypothetical protein
VAANGTSLTVLIPATATTGAVRLERDNAGIFLQIVPTLSSFTANGATAFTLNGTGFAEGLTTVILSGFQIDDPDRNYGTDVYNNNLTLNGTNPVGAPRNLVQVTTIGGTSIALATGQT